MGGSDVIGENHFQFKIGDIVKMSLSAGWNGGDSRANISDPIFKLRSLLVDT